MNERETERKEKLGRMLRCISKLGEEEEVGEAEEKWGMRGRWR